MPRRSRSWARCRSSACVTPCRAFRPAVKSGWRFEEPKGRGGSRPWSQRTVIVRAVLGLEDALDISYADPYRDERGWAFTGGRFTDELNGWDFLERGYRATDPDYDGRVTVPVLWDKGDRPIVSNESADIVRILNEWADGELYPPEKQAEIDELNEWIYSELQNGVYRAGFARSQEAYD